MRHLVHMNLSFPFQETDFICFETGLDQFESYDIDVLLGSTLLLENENSTEESKEPAQNEDVSQMTTTESVEPLESESLDSESTLILESESLRSESKSLLESNSVDSESLHESKAVDSESTLLLESKPDDSESVETPEIKTLQKSAEEDSDGFQPKTDVSSVPTSEFIDALTEETEDIPISQDAEVISEEVETEPSDPDAQDIDYSELLHNQSDSDFEPLEPQTAGLDVAHEEPAKTELKDKDIPLQTPKKTLEDENRPTFKDAFKTEHEGETQENESLQELTKESLSAADVEEQAGLEVTHAQSDFEELANADEAIDFKIPESSHLSPHAKTASDTSQDVPSEPALETESAKAPPALNISEITRENDQEKLAVKVLQKASMSMNENANINTADDPQDAVTKNSEKVRESIGEDEKLKEELVTESPETAPPFTQMDEQIDKVKNELVDLLKNTLESEQQSPEEDVDEDAEEFLEDENALLSSESQLIEGIQEPKENQQPEGDQWVESQQSANTTKQEESDEIRLPPEEPEYSDNVLRLSILRDHLKDEDMERMQKYLARKNLFKIEALFSDLDLEMKSARELQMDTEEIERTLDQILEASENSILDTTEDIFNERDRTSQEHGQQKDPEMYDFEAAILDAFQEIVFALRQKYSAASDSAPLVEEEHLASETDEKIDSEEVKGLDSNVEMIEPPESPATHEEQNESEVILNSELNANKDLSHSKDVGLEEGHFNRNKDAQIGFEDAEEIQKGPHAILEKSVDIGFHFEVDPSSGSLESPSVSDFHDSVSSSSSTADELWALVLLVKEYLGVYGEILITGLPEEWRPGPTLHGVPWEPVVVTAVVGTFTVLMFFWRTVLAIKGRTYQSVLQSSIIWEPVILQNYRKTMLKCLTEKMLVHVLMDEAKLREDAFKAQVLSFEKETGALKEQKKSLLRDAKDWQEKHKKLSEAIRVYHKSQKELEDTLVHKENEIDVLSSCIAELNHLGACDPAELQKDDAKMSNGEDAEKKMDSVRLRIKQMMDVSRIKVTLSVVEDKRNRYVESLLAEQKARQELEEQYQNVMHAQMNLNNEKTHLENQFKHLQQRLEITTELYQQKENALQQKLTQEELERREKETKLSEVDSKAVLSEEEVRALKQKIKDIEDEMQQNERSLKSEVAIQEKKVHENWLKARTSERTLVEERRESATLRQKLVEYRDKISNLEQSLFKLNSGPPDRHMPPQRRGDLYGPSPVSGGAPSPPLMIEGPGRPPSAPVGRRGDPFGPRPPSDPHGRFSDLGHPLPSRPEMFPPMTSSPCAHDGPMQPAPVSETAEASEQVSSEPIEPLSKSQSQGSFLPSPIRDSPVPPPKSYGPPVMPPMMIRPLNGHPPMIPPEQRFRPPPMGSYGPPRPIGPFGPVPPPFGNLHYLLVSL
ncbi:melanoma inhibitory activity protein 3 [Sinocyclocheilus grahami]|uniref:melanoma inhibitory activity protein 3 n=1 Tax=Sinocyclocheilus grahami TaxID=75366 RepID=UPI0007AD2AD2|nr:PREDICTED: melanoma inhibitory activity protein 3 [Sinocyclocheilus grahami]